MIFTECIHCGNQIIIPLEEEYLDLLKSGKQLVSREICDKCNTVNYVEHKRIGGETFGENDDRAKKLMKK